MSLRAPSSSAGSRNWMPAYSSSAHSSSLKRSNDFSVEAPKYRSSASPDPATSSTRHENGRSAPRIGPADATITSAPGTDATVDTLVDGAPSNQPNTDTPFVGSIAGSSTT